MSLSNCFRRARPDAPKRTAEIHEVEDVTLHIKLTGGREATRYFRGRATRSDSVYPSYSGEHLADGFIRDWKLNDAKIIGGHVALWSEFVSATVERCFRTVVLP